MKRTGFNEYKTFGESAWGSPLSQIDLTKDVIMPIEEVRKLPQTLKETFTGRLVSKIESPALAKCKTLLSVAEVDYKELTLLNMTVGGQSLSMYKIGNIITKLKEVISILEN